MMGFISSGPKAQDSSSQEDELSPSFFQLLKTDRALDSAWVAVAVAAAIILITDLRLALPYFSGPPPIDPLGLALSLFLLSLLLWGSSFLSASGRPAGPRLQHLIALLLAGTLLAGFSAGLVTRNRSPLSDSLRFDE